MKTGQRLDGRLPISLSEVLRGAIVIGAWLGSHVRLGLLARSVIHNL